MGIFQDVVRVIFLAWVTVASIPPVIGLWYQTKLLFEVETSEKKYGATLTDAVLEWMSTWDEPSPHRGKVEAVIAYIFVAGLGVSHFIGGYAPTGFWIVSVLYGIFVMSTYLWKGTLKTRTEQA